MKEILYAVLVLGIMGAVFGAVLAIASKVFAVKTDERRRSSSRPCRRELRRLRLRGLSGLCAGRARGPRGDRPVRRGRSGLCRSDGRRHGRHGRKDRARRRHGPLPRSPHRQGPLRRHPRLPLGHVRRRQRPLGLPSGCLGFGSCVSACRFDAIHVVDGVAKVDPEKCTGCLQCAAVCPRKVIVPVSYDADIVIACSNHERGAYTRRECDMGCVGCHLCEKQCEFDAIHVVNNLAVIDYSKCVSCGRCAAVCPRKLISDSNLRQDMDAVPAMPR